MKVFRNYGWRITLFFLLLSTFPVWCSAIEKREPEKEAASSFAVLADAAQSDGLPAGGDASDHEEEISSTPEEESSSQGSVSDTDADDSSTEDSENVHKDSEDDGETLPDGENNKSTRSSDDKKDDVGEVKSSDENHAELSLGSSSEVSIDDKGDKGAGSSDEKKDDVGESDSADGNHAESSSNSSSETSSSDSVGSSEKGSTDNSSAEENGGETGNDNPNHQTTEIHATDIDVGDVVPVAVGTSQVLSVTLIPVNSIDTVVYTSLTPEIASVNQLGRVKGLAVGSANIQISAGEITQTVSVPIVLGEGEEKQEPVEATSIDVEFQEKMTVGTTQTLTVSLLPTNAEPSIQYSSDNESVATVNDFGRVSAVAPGTVNITATADNVHKTIRITVEKAIGVEAMDFADVPTEMTVGTSQTLSVSILPVEAADQTVTYHSSDSDILTVNSFGRITAKSAGTATITARAGEGRCSATITVVPEVHVEVMDFADVPAEMTVGTSQTLSVNILPVEAGNQAVTYRSSNSNVLEVNSFGRVTAKNVGTATITARAGEGKCSASITVVPEIQVEKMDFGDAPTELTVGSSQTLNVSILPVDAANQTVTYRSTNTDVLEVNSFGRVIARQTGVATIIAEAGNASCSVLITVKEEVKAEDIEFSDVQTEMVLGNSQLLNVSILPTEAANRTITYVSSNESVATVNPFGRITAVELGTAEITASVDQVSKTITITVRSKIEPNDIDFEMPDSELLLGSSVNLGASVLPTNAEEQTIRYSSSDPVILTVNAAGKITGRQLGTATVFLEAGNVQKSVTISVVEEVSVSNIEVSQFNKKMKVDSTQTLSTSVFPTDAKNQTISFSSSNTSVASVSEGGVITAKSAGTTAIILRAGKAEKRLDLTVYVATEEIQIPENYLILHPSDQYQIYATVKPGKADQNLSYRSTDSNVAGVTAGGLVTAKSVGRSSIILENDDSMATITIIVNKEKISGVENDEKHEDIPPSGDDDSLAKIIREDDSADTITEFGGDFPFVTNDVLLALYQTQKTLRVAYDKYSILISGSNVRNVNNEFPTNITMQETKEGIIFAVSEGYNLPGNIGVDFTNIPPDYRYLYLYNEATAKYERLNMGNGQTAEIGIPGNYLLTTKKLRSISWPIYSSVAVGGLLLVGVGVYILTKKKYWFW